MNKENTKAAISLNTFSTFSLPALYVQRNFQLNNFKFILFYILNEYFKSKFSSE
jgi:hypothetical protein